MRKRVPIALTVAALLAACVARAAEEAQAIPDDIIKQFAPVAVMLVQQQFPTPPVKVDPDDNKGQGMHFNKETALLVLPDRALTDKTVADAKDKKSPAGVVITRALSVETEDGVGLSGEKLALLDVPGLAKVPIFFLDVKGDKEDGRTLELYSKNEGEPVATAPLKKMEGEAKSSLSVKLTVVDQEKKKAEALFSFPGGYEAKVKLAMVEP